MKGAERLAPDAGARRSDTALPGASYMSHSVLNTFFHLLASLLVVAALTLGCGDPDAPGPGSLSERATISRPGVEGDSVLPPLLHGLELVERQSGPEAAAAIGDLHESGVAPAESHVGYYGQEGPRAILYRSLFASQEEAHSQVQAMARRIGSGRGGFGHHIEADVLGTRVHQVFGYGQVHYFYARGETITWMAASPEVARAILAEVLGIEPDSLPDIYAPFTPPTRERNPHTG